MAKQLVGIAKFHVPGGKATPAPPVGTSLGQFGVNLGQFTKQFNDKTAGDMGLRIPVVVRCYNDRSFEFDAKSPHSVDLLKKLPVSNRVLAMFRKSKLAKSRNRRLKKS